MNAMRVSRPRPTAPSRTWRNRLRFSSSGSFSAASFNASISRSAHASGVGHVPTARRAFPVGLATTTMSQVSMLEHSNKGGCSWARARSAPCNSCFVEARPFRQLRRLNRLGAFIIGSHDRVEHREVSGLPCGLHGMRA